MPEKTTVDLAFAVLEEAASKGRRCPTNLELAAEIASRGGARLAGQSMPGFLRVLTRGGRIVVQIYARNWRQVIICTGAHAGKKDAPTGG